MIKERIVKILEYNKIAKEKFYTEIGMTSANFRGNARKRPINSDAIEKIFSIIPDINLEWLLTGKGEMLKKDLPLKEDGTGTAFTQQIIELLKNQLGEKDRQLSEKDKQIAEKDKQITTLAEALKDVKNGFATPAVKKHRAVR
jgi:hypothetical protein